MLVKEDVAIVLFVFEVEVVRPLIDDVVRGALRRTRGPQRIYGKSRTRLYRQYEPNSR